MIIDSHAHVNFNAFKDDGDEIIKKCLDNNVWVVNVGAEIRTSARAVEYANRYEEGVYAIVGLYPLHIKIDDSLSDITDNEDFNYQEEFIYEDYLDLAKNKKVVAIGEVGLDYHYFKEGDNVESIKKRQAEIFIEIIRLANEVDKPLSIHCRGVKSRKELDHARADAYKDLLEILKNNPVNKKGVLHSFVGSYKTAREFRELGFKLSFNGIITYSESYDKVLTDTPIEDILVETDCPYLTPRPLARDERNDPMNVKYVIEKIAKVKGMEVEEVIKIVEKNTREVFEI
ncbi:MAG: TatD family deoxyribonuclease [Candidatus Moranbacteria bacterium GW2011_GWE1_35_17]|nr:MAG: TatD family deoxyribonuclease [Candidatus Moranbacteria bacterium GW2011_GWE1_35_17]KKP72251.1 MAG: TatD family deoxyribonuclease [Candidatus Moranbacteria bacterium GW2011_GWE2_35_164]KKP84290.1 MAG: TatD family deoxyribonuclease [Candidatus Moranbacteria bacterium GW2011_GWF2_35_54]